MSDDLSQISKFLSLVLRHKPEAIGLTLDPEGWAEIDVLIVKADLPLTRDVIDNVVASSDKKRFALSADGQFIRANQGHSIKVDLGLTPLAPPETLYHGTADRFLDAIMTDGLKPQNRQYVHLSSNPETAQTVGARHGRPVILQLAAKAMHNAGHRFYQAENGVWLTDQVPASDLSRID